MYCSKEGQQLRLLQQCRKHSAYVSAAPLESLVWDSEAVLRGIRPGKRTAREFLLEQLGL